METCDIIPRDVLENILSRLPVKSLLRFKTVSKSWKAVIEDPGFARTHSKQSNISNSQCLFTNYHRDASYSLIIFDGHEFYTESIGRFPLKYESYAYFLCVCEGILVFKYKAYNRRTRGRTFLLLNPFTRNLSTFSCPYDFEKNTKRICDSEGYGLCFDKYEDDYKFVAVLGGGKYLVYSFESDSWVERRCEFGGQCDYPREGIYVNGVVYWVTLESRFHVSNYGIVYFDPKDDLLKKLDAPHDLRHGIRFGLTNLRGNLCLFTRDDDQEYVIEIEIWFLKEDQHHKRWTKIATVPKAYDHEFFSPEIPLYLTSENELVFREFFSPEIPLYLTSENKLVFRDWYSMAYAVYHPDRKRFEEIDNFPPVKRMIEVFPCLESLHFPAIRKERLMFWDQFSSSSHSIKFMI
ncbi:F-box/kelch-repeat protein At3g23880-like [Henckelia pumila]|uniref:F-box/kelch-repeat protein At3g23880-like n=1 Tax=Henckelia pumila TaxID=405737 RepID=UPI003C6E8E1E